jgi:Spy/CpxP family protein refolding chaperone
MKKAFIGMAFAALIATTAGAQDQSTGLAERPKGHHRGNWANLEQLNLTDQQKTEMKSINEDFKQQMTDLKKSEDKITVTEWKSKMATIRKDHHEKVQKVLSDEQKASLKKTMHTRRSDMRKHGGRRNLERMKKELNLTDDQVSALKKNHEDMAQKFKAIRADKNLTDDQKKAELKEFKKQQHESLRSILTAEQLQKLEQQKKDHKGRKHHGQQPPVQS